MYSKRTYTNNVDSKGPALFAKINSRLVIRQGSHGNPRLAFVAVSTTLNFLEGSGFP